MTDAPLILAFDTSAAHCAAALLCGDRIVAARHEDMARGQAERLMPLLEELLTDAGLSWRNLSALAVGTGPGNFTGIRIAVSAARGLALALRIPAIGVDALTASLEGQPGPVIAAIDAKRGAFYLCGRGCEPGEPALVPAEALADLVRPGVALTGPGAEAAAAPLPAPPPTYPPALPLAEAIARIAARRIAAGAPLPRPAPLYLRGADAAPPSDPPPVILP